MRSLSFPNLSAYSLGRSALLSVLVASLPASACRPASTGYQAPEVINSHVVFSSQCSRIIYSSNRDDRFRPFVIHLDGSGEEIQPLPVDSQEDLLVRSLAPDCRTLALVADAGGRGIFDVYLYDLEQKSLRNITRSPKVDDGSPVFSSLGKSLAFLSNSRLVLYDPDSGTPQQPAGQPAPFKSMSWSEDGKRLFLVDEPTNIWEYDPSREVFRMAWRAPRPAYTPRLISNRGEHLFFTSDHESDFTQLYDYNLKSGLLKQLIPAPHDQYPVRYLDANRYLFRENIRGNLIAAVTEDGNASPVSPPNGVVYNLSLEFGDPILVYASDRYPLSIYRMQGAQLDPLIPASFDVAQGSAREIVNEAGMTNLLYMPGPSPRAWLIWLHGGPYEQVSPRFNPYIDFLNRLGIAVYALNYPGSTGIGNLYELRGIPEERRIALQIEQIERDIDQLQSLYPAAASYHIVGVSYGSIPAHLLAEKRYEEVLSLVDFSGIATTEKVKPACRSASSLKQLPVLFIFGRNDFALYPTGRRELMEMYSSCTNVRRLALPEEGHFIKRRSSTDRIFRTLGEFFESSTGGTD